MVAGEVGEVLFVAAVLEDRDVEVGGAVEGLPRSMSVGAIDEGRSGGGVMLRIWRRDGRGAKLGEDDCERERPGRRIALERCRVLGLSPSWWLFARAAFLRR